MVKPILPRRTTLDSAANNTPAHNETSAVYNRIDSLIANLANTGTQSATGYQVIGEAITMLRILKDLLQK